MSVKRFSIRSESWESGLSLLTSIHRKEYSIECSFKTWLFLSIPRSDGHNRNNFKTWKFIQSSQFYQVVKVKRNHIVAPLRHWELLKFHFSWLASSAQNITKTEARDGGKLGLCSLTGALMVLACVGCEIGKQVRLNLIL